MSELERSPLRAARQSRIRDASVDRHPRAHPQVARSGASAKPMMAPRRLEPAVENSARTCLYLTTVARSPAPGRSHRCGRNADRCARCQTVAVISEGAGRRTQARTRGRGHVARGSRELDVGDVAGRTHSAPASDVTRCVEGPPHSGRACGATVLGSQRTIGVACQWRAGHVTVRRPRR